MDLPATDLSPAVTGVAVAFGAGLLIGLERERRKGQGADRAAAGVRTFLVASLAGALSAAVGVPGVVPVVVLAVSAMAALSYWRTSVHDPGLTTELALVVTCLIGVLAVSLPALAAGAAALLAVLLAARERLHHFATRALTEAELQDALWLAAIALVLLPLMPARPLPWLAGLEPRTMVGLVVLILMLQAVGHVALRLAGPRAGLTLSGLFGGLVSSTATIASMGSRVRAEPARRAGGEAGALMSTAATWLKTEMMLAAVSPPAALAMLPAALAGFVVAGAGGALRMRAETSAPPVAADLSSPGPLRLREAALVALILSAVALLVGWTQQQFGTAGLLAGTALGALADAHSSIAALGALHASGEVTMHEVGTALLVAVAANSVVRTVLAAVSGGTRFGLVVGLSLAASTGAAAAVWVGLR